MTHTDIVCAISAALHNSLRKLERGTNDRPELFERPKRGGRYPPPVGLRRAVDALFNGWLKRGGVVVETKP
jgi:hypothetical protein